MLRLIAGFEAPTRGRILIAGKDITDLPPNQRKVNTVFQSYALFPHMNVFDNVAFGLKMSRIAPDEVRSRVIAMLRMVALEEMAGRKPNQLSGGQQQRVAIARAAVNNPLVLLLDEPLSALDAKLRKQMQRELKHLQRRLGITFIHVTHDQQEALSVSDRVAVLQDGCIQQIGTPVEVYENPVSLKVAKFVGETNILDGEILGLEEQLKDGSVKALVEGQAKPCLLKTKEALSSGQRIKVMLRPEDLLVNRQKPAGDDNLWIEGQVDETIYKGTTYDIAITLTNGKQLLVTEFFDENDESMIAAAGERVFVSWIKGWEIVFIDEDAQSV
jgi:spermidine/putrescine transport system ATP-binding protein